MSLSEIVCPEPGYKAFGKKRDVPTTVKYEDDNAGFRQHTKYHMHRLVRANLVQSKATRRHPNGRQIVNSRLTLARFIQWVARTRGQTHVHLVRAALLNNWWRDAVTKCAEKNPFGSTMPEPSDATIAAKIKREIAELSSRIDDWTQEVRIALFPHCPEHAICGLISSFAFRHPFRQPIPTFVATEWRELETSEETVGIRRTKFGGTPFLPLGFDWDELICREKLRENEECNARFQMDLQLNPSDLPPEAVAQWPEELRGNNVLQLFELFCAEGCGTYNPLLPDSDKSQYMPLVLQPTVAEAQNPENLLPLVKGRHQRGRVVEKWTKRDDFPHFNSQLNEAMGFPPHSDEFGDTEYIDYLLDAFDKINGVKFYETKMGGYSYQSDECIAFTTTCPHCGDCESPLTLLFEHIIAIDFEILYNVVCCSKHPRDTVEVRYVI